MSHPPTVPVTNAFVDPRPPLKVEKEKVHDFEVHREGGYAKGKTFPSKEVTAAPTDAVAIGAQPHQPTAGVTAPVGDTVYRTQPPAAFAADPRPPLQIEKERVHDFEAHREGAYIKSARGHGEGLTNVPGGPAGSAQPHHSQH